MMRGRMHNQLRIGAFVEDCVPVFRTMRSTRISNVRMASFPALELNELSISTALGSSGPIGLVVGTDEPFTE